MTGAEEAELRAALVRETKRADAAEHEVRQIVPERTELVALKRAAAQLTDRIGGLEEDLRNAKQQAYRLAVDALAALAGAGITTPEEGYVRAPFLLEGDIGKLAKQRDLAIDEAMKAEQALKKFTDDRALLARDLAVARMKEQKLGEACDVFRARIVELEKQLETANKAVLHEKALARDTDIQMRMHIESVARQMRDKLNALLKELGG